MPGGRPARGRRVETRYWTLRGAFSEGLIITEFPAAKAGASFFIVINRGWFQGVINAITPIGRVEV